MNLEDKARDYSYRQTCMDSIIEKLTIEELDHVTKLQITAYIAGHQSRDEEVKRLKEELYRMFQYLKTGAPYGFDDFPVVASLIKELKER